MKKRNSIFCLACLVLTVVLLVSACAGGRDQTTAIDSNLDPTDSTGTETTVSTETTGLGKEPPMIETSIFSDYQYQHKGRDRDWEEDVVFLAKAFLEKHPLICDTYYFEQCCYGDNIVGNMINDNHFFSQDLRNMFIEQALLLIDNIPDMDDAQIRLELQRIVAMLCDAHSYVDIIGETFYPIMLEKLVDEDEFAYYLVRVPAEHEAYLYSRLVAINGVPVEDVIDLLRPYISAENAYLEEFKIYESFWNSLLIDHSVLQVVGVIDQNENTAQFTFMTEGGNNENLTMSAITFDEYLTIDMARVDFAARGISLWSNSDKNYWYAAWDDGTLYTRISKCRETSGYAFQTYCSEILGILRASEESQKLIIDLRGNTGGSYPMSGFLDFVVALEKMPQHQVYILIDHGVASAAVGMAAKLSGSIPNVVFVGTPTGQPANSWGNMSVNTMPNSQIRFYISKEYWMFTQTQEADAILPDITVYQTLEHYINGTDTVLEYVRTIE